MTGGPAFGRAAAIAFAKEGAHVVITYFDEHADAEDTRQKILASGRECITLAGDIGDPGFCQEIVRNTIAHFGKLDILVNNAAEQHPHGSIEDIEVAQLERTFRTNIFSMFYVTKVALPHLQPGARIVNTTSVTAYLTGQVLHPNGGEIING